MFQAVKQDNRPYCPVTVRDVAYYLTNVWKCVEVLQKYFVSTCKNDSA